jgi:hypothetical protein
MSPEVELSLIPFGSRPHTSASGRAMDMFPSPTNVPSTFDCRVDKRLAHKKKRKMKSKIRKRTKSKSRSTR